MSSHADRCQVCGTPLSGRLGGNCPTCLMGLAETVVISKADLVAKPDSPPPGEGRVLGDYELLEEIARGGMGVVYRARQRRLNRLVAVKVVLTGGFADAKSLQRFQREAEAVASLNHPNIVAIYEVGEAEGQPYYSMEIIEGRTLAQLTHDNPAPARQAARWLQVIAEALQYAHEQGVLHRDLKPSNVIVDKADVPHVTDFGLAKLADGSVELTVTGEVLGTPSYMSPEQADPKSGETNALSDVYSMGAILYHLLTARPPFIAESLSKTLRLVAEGEPVAPRLLNPGVPRDLETICLKCLEKEPSRRYTTARQLSEELGRFLRGEPIRARPIGVPARVWRWCQRKPALAATGAAALLAAIVGFAGISWEWRIAEKNRQTARRKSYDVSINLIQQALASDNLGRATELLNAQRPEPGQEDLRGWEWRYLWQFCQSDPCLTICTRNGPIYSVSFSADGAFLAVGTYAGELSVWEVAKREMIFREDCEGGLVNPKFAARGDVLAYRQGTNVVLRNARTRAEVGRLPVGKDFRDLTFLSETGLLTAVTYATNAITLWDTVTCKPLTNFHATINDAAVGTLLLAAPDGKRFAHRAGARTMSVMDLTGNAEWGWMATEEQLDAMAFSPDGALLATGSGFSDTGIKVWNLETHRLVTELEGHRSYVSALKFLRDGATLASASGDQTIRLWDAKKWVPLRTLRGNVAEVLSIDASPDDRLLASGAKDGTVLLWNLTTSLTRPPPYRLLEKKGQTVHAVYTAVSPDGQLIATVEQNGIQLYDGTTLRWVASVDFGLKSEELQNPIAFSPDGQLLVGTDDNGKVGVFDLLNHRRLTNFTAHADYGELVGSGFVSGGQSLVTCGTDNLGREWNTRTWSKIREWPMKNMKDGLTAANLSADLVAFSAGGFIEVFSPHDPGKRTRIPQPFAASAICFSPDGKVIAAASTDGSVRLFDARTGTSQGALRGVLLGLHSVGFSVDGRRIIGGSNGKEAIKIWDAISHEELSSLEGKGSIFMGASFSPDGNSIIAHNWNGAVEIWRAPFWKEIEKAESERLAASEAAGAKPGEE
jgi:WD40 repeat protein/predicted Ser/Thr protein kinase